MSTPNPQYETDDRLALLHSAFVEDLSATLNLTAGTADATQIHHLTCLTGDLRSTLDVDAGLTAIIIGLAPVNSVCSVTLSELDIRPGPGSSGARRFADRFVRLDPSVRFSPRTDASSMVLSSRLRLVYVIDLARAVALALDLAHDLARALDRVRDQDLDLDLIRALALDFARALDLAHDLALGLNVANILNRFLDLAIVCACDLARDLDHDLARARARARDLDIALSHALNLALDLDITLLHAPDFDRDGDRALTRTLARARALASSRALTRIRGRALALGRVLCRGRGHALSLNVADVLNSALDFALASVDELMST